MTGLEAVQPNALMWGLRLKALTIPYENPVGGPVLSQNYVPCGDGEICFIDPTAGPDTSWEWLRRAVPASKMDFPASSIPGEETPDFSRNIHTMLHAPRIETEVHPVDIFGKVGPVRPDIKVDIVFKDPRGLEGHEINPGFVSVQKCGFF